MSDRKKALTRGARATFYRDGSEVFGACDIPEAGAFATRELPPGQWLVRDSCGGEQAFSVSSQAELTVILPGDSVGPTGGPGLSGVAEGRSLNVGRDPLYRSVDQVAADEGVMDRLRVAEGAEPAEVSAPVPDADRPSERPRDLGREERVPGQAGAPFELDVPVRSVDEVAAAGEERGRLGEEERAARAAEDAERAAGLEVPRVVAPGERGPEPDRSTLPPEGYGEVGGEETPVEREPGDVLPEAG
jgi:hypothetical protein